MNSRQCRIVFDQPVSTYVISRALIQAAAAVSCPLARKLGLSVQPAVIPGDVDAERFAHGAGGAAMRKIKDLYRRRAEWRESKARAAV